MTAQAPQNPTSLSIGYCTQCDEEHDWQEDEYMECVPPLHVLCFGEYTLDPNYRQAVYQHCKKYNTEEVVGSFLGHNPHFPSQEKWINGDSSDEEDLSHADLTDTDQI
jgi:hypothetical protein